MTHVLALLAFLILPLVGIAVWRLEGVRQMDLGGRIAVAGAAGALIVSILLPLYSMVGIHWNRTSVGIALVVIIALGCSAGLPARRPRQAGKPAPHLAIAGIGLFFALAAYGTLTARMTCGDLHFFWAPKGIHFYRDGGVTVAFLSDINNFLMHRDYPLLLPTLYSLSNVFSHEFSWWVAVFSTALFILGSAAIVRSTSHDDAGAVLFAGTLAYCFAVAYAAGGADPPLIFFETLAIAALTFIDHPKSRDILAAIGVAGAVWTKVEGLTFAIAIFIAVLVVQRSLKRALLIVLPGALILGGWMIFLERYDLFDSYRMENRDPMHWNVLPVVLREVAKYSTYAAWCLPWLVPAALLPFGKLRPALFPLLVFALTLGVLVYFYLHNPDPAWWISASAPRVLLTPLVALLIASVAAWRDRTI